MAFQAKGFEMMLCSIKGGKITFDNGSMSGDFFTETCKAFSESEAAKLTETSIAIADAKADILACDALYIPGGHACYTDLWDSTLCELIAAFYAANKAIGVDCHGPVALCNDELKKPDGTALVAGLTVTSFSDAEEAQLGVTEKIPYSTEQKLKTLGATFKAGDPWSSHVCTSGVLVTGQNPQSSEACAEAVMALMG